MSKWYKFCPITCSYAESNVIIVCCPYCGVLIWNSSTRKIARGILLFKVYFLIFIKITQMIIAITETPDIIQEYVIACWFSVIFQTFIMLIRPIPSQKLSPSSNFLLVIILLLNLTAECAKIFAPRAALALAVAQRRRKAYLKVHFFYPFWSIYSKRDKLVYFSYSAMPQRRPRLTPKGVLEV